MANDIPEHLFRRMVLANQYRILSHLDSDDKEYWERAAEMVSEGWPVENLPGVDVMQSYMRDALTRQDQKFVLDALNVFELLQDASKRGAAPKREHTFVEFPGFDGNNEGKLLSYARHVRDNEGRFTYVKLGGRDLNSHWPTVEMYQRMIAEWERQGRPQRLTESQFDALLEAQVHPSQRRQAGGEPQRFG
jgi:uncharacterized protein